MAAAARLAEPLLAAAVAAVVSAGGEAAARRAGLRLRLGFRALRKYVKFFCNGIFLP